MKIIKKDKKNNHLNKKINLIKKKFKDIDQRKRKFLAKLKLENNNQEQKELINILEEGSHEKLFEFLNKIKDYEELKKQKERIVVLMNDIKKYIDSKSGVDITVNDEQESTVNDTLSDKLVKVECKKDTEQGFKKPSCKDQLDTSELIIEITQNKLLKNIKFILGTEIRELKNNRTNRCVLYKKDKKSAPINVGEFRGPLKNDEDDDSEKTCRIIWNKQGHELLSELKRKL